MDPESVVSPSGAQYITSNRTHVQSLSVFYTPPLSLIFIIFFPHPLTKPHNHSLNNKDVLKDLTAVEKLKQPQYNITARDIQSSVESFLSNSLDYTVEDMTSKLETPATLPSNQQWFALGAAGEGAFTIPVCDIGNNTGWMGRGMPCCCGKLPLPSSFLPSSDKNVS